ncbi:hypothetical protein [Roseospira visakhapatnamensis]|uniref:Flp pilus assembly protein TadB n=1 Tax=Roseospira visakhapatnamensis TaxID=390880 RepID=A0A7W6W8I8_9PROT|nr:hypothetical protein [Roseospira visakhapatnamensis]MBB4265055.1 Flp pilus assembly protein TadB [Roseospira visakhapatnamensis]
MTDMTDMTEDRPPTSRRLDLQTVLWHGLFAVLLVFPAMGLVVGVLVVLAGVPILVALFPVTLTLAAVALGVLYARHRRARAGRGRG